MKVTDFIKGILVLSFAGFVFFASLPDVQAGSQAFTTSGTWTRPAGVTIVDVSLVGGGGGGGGSRTASGLYYGGGGGGGGGSTFDTVTVSGNVTVTIGAGGAGGGVNANGSGGGNTTFGGLATADGGGGGGRPDTGSAGTAGTGGYAGGTGGAGGSNTVRNNSGGGGGGGAWASAGSTGGGGQSSGSGSCVTGLAGGAGGAGGTSNPNTGTGGDGGEGDNSPADTPGETYGGGGGGAGNNASCVGEGSGTWAGSDGADGYLLVEWDETAPTPNPMTFSTAPDDASVSSIDMTASLASDPIGGVEYYFNIQTCASDGGTGGSNSGWQASRSYTDTGLQTNKCYRYRVRAQDANANITTYSSTQDAYTTAATPGTPTVGGETSTTLDLTHNANGNPSSAPVTTFAVQVSSTDGTWDGMYVDAAGDPSVTAVWLSDATWDSMTVDGLDPDTTYQFRSKARNGDNDETAFSSYGSGTTLETDPPTPDPMTFAVAPDDVSVSSIDMTGTTATDATGPIDYYFTAVTGSCGANLGTGGTDSGWQTSDTTYTDTGLQTNKCYGYTVTARDSIGNAGTASGASVAYTTAATPGAPSLGNAGATTLDITHDANGNPSSAPVTTFAVQASSTDVTWNGKYVDAAGDPSVTAVWLSDATWDSMTVQGLDANTKYDFRSKARNGDNDETAFSAYGSGTTVDNTAPTPDPMTFATAPDDASVSSVDMVASTATDAEGSTPVEYYFGFEACASDGGTGGTNSGWQVGTTYTDTVLQTNQCYGYTVAARDSIGNITASSSASEAYTAAATPGTPTLGNESATTVDITHDANGNPSSNPVTTFAVQASSSDATWNGKYVDAAGDPSDTAVWLPDATWDSVTVQGLNEATTYEFRSKARNGDNDETSFSAYGTVTTSNTAPTPNPMTFAVAPDDTGTSSIDMTSTAGSDDSTPISYYFTATSSSCAADWGTGGTNSGWQSADTTYEDTGLQVNQCYGYMVTARDSLGNTGATSSASTAYTAAAVPGQPTFTALSSTTARIYNDEGINPTANPATEFAVQVVNSSPNDGTWEDQYVNGSGNPSASAVWLTDSQIDGLILRGLNEGTTYAVQIKARNGDGDETGFSVTSQGSTTLEPVARLIRMSGNARLQGIRLH